MSKTSLCIIGAGEVVRERYSRGLATAKNLSNFRVDWICDILPEAYLTSTLQHFSDAVYIQVSPSISQAANQIIQTVPPDAVVVIATPVQLHIPYALLLLGKYRLIAIEKPLTNSEQQYTALESLSNQLNCSWFPLAYYLIEKALPYLLLMRSDFRISPYLDLVEPKIELQRLTELRNDLGYPRKIVGCILEGIDSAGSLDRRPWVLTPEAGGNTWETLFHLTCLIAVSIDQASKHFTIEQSYKGIVREVISNFSGFEPEDTANLVHLTTEQTSATIFAAKYLSAESHQRWLKIECEGGEVVLDFSNAAMVVETKNDKVNYQLCDPTPYATQFSLLNEMVKNPTMLIPENIYRDAFRLNSQIYEFSKSKVSQPYSKKISVNNLVNSIGVSDPLKSLWQKVYSVARKQ